MAEYQNSVRRNQKGDIQMGATDGRGRSITKESSIRLGNIIDDYGDDQGYKPDYNPCSSCQGSGRITPREISFGFSEGSYHNYRKGVTLVLVKPQRQ